MKKIVALSITDIKNISRDSTLLLMLFGPIALFCVLRFGIPLVTTELANTLSFDLTTYYPLIISFMGLIPSMLFGMLVGFLILDERDEEIIAFIAITPLGKSGYLQYKIFISSITAYLFYFVIVYLTGLVSIPIKYTIGLAGMAALEAPMAVLFLASFAANKVEGMALGKLFGMIYLGPFVAFFVKSDLQWLAGILPPFWVTKAYVAAGINAPVFWFYLGMGLIVHILVIFILLKRFLAGQR